MLHERDYTVPVSSRSPLVVAIVGATGTGKSEVALEVALRFGGTIISADSMQVYRGMDIGTAKLPVVARRGVPHAVIDVVAPDHHFSVAEYQALAVDAIAAAHASGRLPILVGGTGLYIRAVLDGYEFLPEKPDTALRRCLRELSEDELRLRLEAIDPQAASEIAPNDVKRLERALEMHVQSGDLPSVIKRRQHAVPWRTLRIGLRVERSELYRRLDERVDTMLAEGVEEEVRQLLAGGLGPDDTAMQGIGYKELSAWIRGEMSRDAVVELWKQRTRNYAKRQETWFKKDAAVRWIDVSGRSRDEVLNQVAGLVESAVEGENT
jgi:tRNA dimethylallyltransferase